LKEDGSGIGRKIPFSSPHKIVGYLPDIAQVRFFLIFPGFASLQWKEKRHHQCQHWNHLS